MKTILWHYKHDKIDADIAVGLVDVEDDATDKQIEAAVNAEIVNDMVNYGTHKIGWREYAGSSD